MMTSQKESWIVSFNNTICKLSISKTKSKTFICASFYALPAVSVVRNGATEGTHQEDSQNNSCGFGDDEDHIDHHSLANCSNKPRWTVCSNIKFKLPVHASNQRANTKHKILAAEVCKNSHTGKDTLYVAVEQSSSSKDDASYNYVFLQCQQQHHLQRLAECQDKPDPEFVCRFNGNFSLDKQLSSLLKQGYGPYLSAESFYWVEGKHLFAVKTCVKDAHVSRQKIGSCAQIHRHSYRFDLSSDIFLGTTKNRRSSGPASTTSQSRKSFLLLSAVLSRKSNKIHVKCFDACKVIPDLYASSVQDVIIIKLVIGNNEAAKQENVTDLSASCLKSHILLSTCQEYIVELKDGRVVRSVAHPFTNIQQLHVLEDPCMYDFVYLFALSKEGTLTCSQWDQALGRCQDNTSALTLNNVARVLFGDFIGYGSAQALIISSSGKETSDATDYLAEEYPPEHWMITDFNQILINNLHDDQDNGGKDGPRMNHGDDGDHEDASRDVAVRALAARLQNDIDELRIAENDKRWQLSLIKDACHDGLPSMQHSKGNGQPDMVNMGVGLVPLICSSTSDAQKPPSTKQPQEMHKSDYQTSVNPDQPIRVLDIWQRVGTDRWLVGVKVANTSEVPIHDMSLVVLPSANLGGMPFSTLWDCTSSWSPIDYWSTDTAHVLDSVLKNKSAIIYPPMILNDELNADLDKRTKTMDQTNQQHVDSSQLLPGHISQVYCHFPTPVAIVPESHWTVLLSFHYAKCDQSISAGQNAGRSSCLYGQCGWIQCGQVSLDVSSQSVLSSIEAHLTWTHAPVDVQLRSIHTNLQTLTPFLVQEGWHSGPSRNRFYLPENDSVPPSIAGAGIEFNPQATLNTVNVTLYVRDKNRLVSLLNHLYSILPDDIIIIPLNQSDHQRNRLATVFTHCLKNEIAQAQSDLSNRTCILPCAEICDITCNLSRNAAQIAMDIIPQESVASTGEQDKFEPGDSGLDERHKLKLSRKMTSGGSELPGNLSSAQHYKLGTATDSSLCQLLSYS